MGPLPPNGTRTSPTIERRLLFLVATLLLANPVVFFLLFEQVLPTVLVCGFCVVLMQVCISRHAWRLIAAYAFNFIALFSIGGHAEVLLRTVFSDYFEPNLYSIERGYYFNLPNLDRQFVTDEYSIRYRTNSQGFRIAEGMDAGQTVSEVDWLFLGDSFTQGAQVDFEQLYTTQLYARFPDKIVLNVAISGLGIAHEYNYFVDAGARLKPTLVVLQVGSFNDFMNVEPRSPSLTDRLMARSAFIRLIQSRLAVQDTDLPLGRWTEPFYAERRKNADYNIFFRETSPAKERDLQLFTEYLTRLRDAVSASGAKLLVVLLPSKEQVSMRHFKEVLQAFSLKPEELDMRRPNQFVGDLTQQLGVEFLDVLPSFLEQDDTVFFDHDEHLNVHGHTVLAGALGAYLTRTRGVSGAELLSKDLAGDRYPMVSRDGLMMTYQSVRDGAMDIFVASRDLSQRRQITANNVDDSHPMLSPDGRQIVFTTGSAASMQTDVGLMNIDGSHRVMLTPEPDVFGAIPTFSPDGTTVTYAQWTRESADRYTLPQIVMVELRTRQRTVITAAGRETWRPVFSPDRKSVAYIAKVDGQFDLFISTIDSKAEKRLTATTFDEWDPQFTPDGEFIVYAARMNGNWDLCEVKIDSGRINRLTDTRGDEWDPHPTHDGHEILFAGRFGLVEAMYRLRPR